MEGPEKLLCPLLVLNRGDYGLCLTLRCALWSDLRNRCCLVACAEMSFLALKTWERILKKADLVPVKTGTR
ncbi:MAG: hypothetical protein A2V67_11990 [Deltaproteobacteria bacterium RBG_13_61_14]|nr:MAG: hypothetical protein A2V67_11990 [Deltaproteobacteria bacterium RBG_13_61_14]